MNNERQTETGRVRSPRTPKRGRRRKVEGTQEKILDAAEELFSRHGLHGVTIKDVAARAKVDTALLHYYFTDKQGMFDSVFGRRAEIGNRERMESLARYEREAGAGQTLEGVIDAFIRPLIELAQNTSPGWRNYCALVAQINNAPGWGGATMTRYFDPVVHRFIDMVCALLSGAKKEDIYWCYQLLSGSITLMLSRTGRIDRLSNGLCRSDDLAAVYARIVPYAAAGFRAACRTAPAKKQRARAANRKQS